MSAEGDWPEKTSTHLCSVGVASSLNVSFNTAPPERLRPTQHPSLSIFCLFTSRFMSLHANSITGIKIVCPIHPQTLLPLVLLPPLTPHTTYRLSGPRAELGDYRTSSTRAPRETQGGMCWRMFRRDVRALAKAEVWSMAVARVCTSEHFAERLREKKEKMKVCYDMGLGV